MNLIELQNDPEFKEYVRLNIQDEYQIDKYGIIHWVEPCAYIVVLNEYCKVKGIKIDVS